VKEVAETDKKVDEYIAKQKSPQKEILSELRKIVHKTLPKVKEKMWVGVPWVEDRYYIVGLKDHVNMGFCIEGLSKKELELFEGAGKTMRHIKIHTTRDIDEGKIVRLIKLVDKKAKPSC
jgi:hypothetical protein